MDLCQVNSKTKTIMGITPGVFRGGHCYLAAEHT
jgi:hypothetical protein